MLCREQDSCLCTGTAKEETWVQCLPCSQIIAVGPAGKGVHSEKVAFQVEHECENWTDGHFPPPLPLVLYAKGEFGNINASVNWFCVDVTGLLKGKGICSWHIEILGIAQRKVDFSAAPLTGVIYIITGVTFLCYINLRIISSYLHGGALLTSFNLGLCISHIPDLPSYQTHHGLQQIRWLE